jgi:HAD superfamily hydrolase (TIGR01509 family)
MISVMPAQAGIQFVPHISWIPAFAGMTAHSVFPWNENLESRRMTEYAAALFDMDGLLVDSERAMMDAWSRVAARRGIAFPEAAYIETVGRDREQSDAIMARVFGGIEAARAARREAAEVLNGMPPDQRFPLKAGARALLDSLQERRIPCAVASSSTRDEIEERLGLAGVLSCFAAMAAGNEVPAGKPDPAVYLLAAKRLGIPAACCLAFEDSQSGAQAVLASGAGLVIVPDLVRPTADAARRAVEVLRSLEEAVSRVDDWFG